MTWDNVEAYWRDRLEGPYEVAPKASNFLKYLAYNDCARPWFVYAETFFPAFLKLGLTLSVLQWDDIVRAAAAGKATNTRAGRGRLGHTAKTTVNIEDPDDEGRAYRRGLKTLLVLTKPLETIGFAFLVYGAGEQFYADWMSLLEQSVYCTRQAVFGPYGRSGSNFALLASPDGQGFGMDTLNYNAPNFGDTTAAVTLPAGVYDVALGLNVQRQGSTDATVAAGIRVFGGGDTELMYEGVTTVTPDAPTQLVFGGSVTIPFGQTRSLAWVLVGDDIPTGYFMHNCDIKISPRRYY